MTGQTHIFWILSQFLITGQTHIFLDFIFFLFTAHIIHWKKPPNLNQYLGSSLSKRGNKVIHMYAYIHTRDILGMLMDH